MIGAKTRLKCHVKRSKFSTDRLVHVEAGGASCRGIVDENLITDGMLVVQVLRIVGDLAEVILPGSFEGHLIGVNRSDIEVLEKEYVF